MNLSTSSRSAAFARVRLGDAYFGRAKKLGDVRQMRLENRKRRVDRRVIAVAH